MARVDFNQMAAKSAAKRADPTSEAPTAAVTPIRNEPAPSRPARKRAQRQPAPPAAAPERVRFDEYERKEARVRADQYENLNAVSRQLNRARNGSGVRLTENTLIRVAIDLLLARRDELAGTTEDELRKSVGL